MNSRDLQLKMESNPQPPLATPDTLLCRASCRTTVNLFSLVSLHHHHAHSGNF